MLKLCSCCLMPLPAENVLSEKIVYLNGHPPPPQILHMPAGSLESQTLTPNSLSLEFRVWELGLRLCVACLLLRARSKIQVSSIYLGDTVEPNIE